MRGVRIAAAAGRIDAARTAGERRGRAHRRPGARPDRPAPSP